MIRGRALAVTLCGALAVLLIFGMRTSVPLFMNPVSLDLGIGRQDFALAFAISHLMMGAFQPLIGAVADRFGSGIVVFLGCLVMAASMILTTLVTDTLGLNLTMGFMGGLAMAMATFGPVMGAVGRAVPVAGRTLAFGIVTAAASAGMFIMVPFGQMLIDLFAAANPGDPANWKDAMLSLAAIAAATSLVAIGIAGRFEVPGGQGAADQTVGQALGEAMTHSGYLMLTAGYFVCGFHVAFIGTHLPAFAADQGLDAAAGAQALSLIGAFNILGSFFFGWSGDRFRKKHLLSLIYFGRAVVLVIFIMVPVTQVTILAFGAAMGFLWLGTVPLTNGLVAQIFGVRYLAMLGGIVFFSHQIGSFLGAWMGGWAFDTYQSYDMVWWASVALGLFAALIHWPIADRPVERAAEPAKAAA